MERRGEKKKECNINRSLSGLLLRATTPSLAEYFHPSHLRSQLCSGAGCSPYPTAFCLQQVLTAVQETGHCSKYSFSSCFVSVTAPLSAVYSLAKLSFFFIHSLFCFFFSLHSDTRVHFGLCVKIMSDKKVRLNKGEPGGKKIVCVACQVRSLSVSLKLIWLELA